MSAPELQLQEELPEGKPGAPQAPDPTPGKRLSHTPLLYLGWQAMPGPGASSGTDGPGNHLS